jgi:hypothetical protein
MTQSDFEQIERRLDVTLPRTYTALLAVYPPDADDDIRSHGLFSDPDRVIEENIAHRRDGWFHIPWPDHYFVIGDDGCGDTYFMVLGKDEHIYFADHEGGSHPLDELEGCLASDTLHDHITSELKISREIEEGYQARTTRRRNKPWWLFWK